jgi:hypothetical protein
MKMAEEEREGEGGKDTAHTYHKYHAYHTDTQTHEERERE